MKLVYLAAAEEEIAAVVRRYELASPGLGDKFLETVESGVELLKMHHFAGKSLFDDYPDVREFVIGRFPFTLVYQVEQDQLSILAVTHHSRSPDYWQSRIQEESANYAAAA